MTTAGEYPASLSAVKSILNAFFRRIPSVFSGYGDALLFDSNKQPKPAYYAVASALAAATTSGVRAILPFRHCKELTECSFKIYTG